MQSNVRSSHLLGCRAEFPGVWLLEPGRSRRNSCPCPPHRLPLRCSLPLLPLAELAGGSHATPTLRRSKDASPKATRKWVLDYPPFGCIICTIASVHYGGEPGGSGLSLERQMTLWGADDSLWREEMMSDCHSRLRSASAKPALWPVAGTRAEDAVICKRPLCLLTGARLLLSRAQESPRLPLGLPGP